MIKNLSYYIKSFEKLRVDKTHGIAPHKPILLLSVLQSFNSGYQNSERIYLTPELVALFKSNWNQLVTSNHECRISYPFYHLKSSKFWHLIPRNNCYNIENLGSLIKNLSSLNTAIECAIIDRELFLLCIDSSSNRALQETLLNKFFANTKYNWDNYSSEQSKIFDEITDKILNESAIEYREEVKILLQENKDEEIFIRGSLFKREIPKIYNNTCCISGMRVDSIANVSMIDACHIVPFSISFDDTIKNGIALCPNLHRAFDRGLITIDKNYRVIVSNNFRENETNFSLKQFNGIKIMMPVLSSYQPLEANFEWHRNNIFK
jgi:putative restriction endonuclease